VNRRGGIDEATIGHAGGVGVILDQRLIVATVLSVTIKTLIPPPPIYWKVSTSDGAKSTDSTMRSFTRQ